MASILEKLRTTGGDEIILDALFFLDFPGLEPRALVRAYHSMRLTLDDVEYDAEPTTFEMALPKRDASLSQSLQLIVADTEGALAGSIRSYLSLYETLDAPRVVHAVYTDDDLSEPKEKTEMIFQGATFSGGIATITCGFFSLIDSPFPKKRYDRRETPLIF